MIFIVLVLNIIKLKYDMYVYLDFLIYIIKCLLFYVVKFRVVCSVVIVFEIDFDIWKCGVVIIKFEIYSIDFGVGWLVEIYKVLRRLLVRG